MKNIAQITATLGLLFLSILFTIPLTAGNPWVSRHGLTGAQYQAKVTELDGDGYRIMHMSAFSVNGTPYFNAIWEKDGGPDRIAKHGLTPAQYQTEVTNWNGQGYRLVIVEGYNVGNTAKYAAVWEKDNTPEIRAKHGLTSAEYQTEYNKNKSEGYHLDVVDGMGINGTAYYAAIWRKGVNNNLLCKHGLSSAQYQAEVTEWAGKGYQIKWVSSFNVGNTDYYTLIMSPTTDPTWSARHDMNAQTYQVESDNKFYTGFKPYLITGCSDGVARYAAVWENTGAWNKADLDMIYNSVDAYMKKYNVPGASIAITKDGNLVYARGFGLADKSTGEKVGTSSLFRIASTSKPFTSAAIMKLLQQDGNNNTFEMSSKVFGTGGLLANTYGTSADYSVREKDITLQNLLEHTAGGGPWDQTNDPMGSNSSFNHAQLIGNVLDTQEPDADPGDVYNYSNFGYCVLGRIIEKKTAKTYQNYVKESILAPCGITKMTIAGDTQADKKPNEVVYYGQGGDNPYAWKVTRMDSHGGWIASPIDLARFCTHVDGFGTVPDILSASTIETMTTPCSVNNGYAKGWSVDASDEWWHMGSLPATGAIMMRTSSGYTISFVTNSKVGNTVFFSDMNTLVRGILSGVNNWPSGVDFF